MVSSTVQIPKDLSHPSFITVVIVHLYIAFELLKNFKLIWNHDQHVFRLFSLMVTSYCLGRKMANSKCIIFLQDW